MVNHLISYIDTSPPVESAVEFLVLKMMAGRREILEALLKYVNGTSPSIVCSVYGISKHRFRGSIQRMYNKAKSKTLATLLMKLAIPIILRETGVYIDRSRRPEECTICGAELYKDFPESHIKRNHRDIIEREKQKIIFELKRMIREKIETMYLTPESLSLAFWSWREDLKPLQSIPHM